MTEPTTQTGKRLAGEGWVATYTDDILAIEREAADLRDDAYVYCRGCIKAHYHYTLADPEAPTDEGG